MIGTLEASPNIDTALQIIFETFKQAQQAEKGLSDVFIDGAIKGVCMVGSEKVGIKGYLDKVESTKKDREVIDDPERIAGLYLRTTEMVTRNLRIFVTRSTDAQQAQKRRGDIKQVKEMFLNNLNSRTSHVVSEIIDWCNGSNKKFPVDALEYHGFEVDGIDVLDAEGKSLSDVRPNFKIQRQVGGIFVMAYTDSQVQEKIAGTDEVLDKRIYLNPNIEAAPELFEKLLHIANEAGISMQLKMFQRVSEVARAHKLKFHDGESLGLRGDGIVVYVDNKHCDQVLGLVIALAKENPAAFKDRKTSRIPARVADGIAVGDEPQMLGTSLTSHREKIFTSVAQEVRKSGKQGEEARILFRDLVAKKAIENGVDPNNIAFNR